MWDTWDLGAEPLALVERSQLIGWTHETETLVLYDGSKLRYIRVSSAEADTLPSLAVGDVQSIDVHPAGDRLLVVRALGENQVAAEIWPIGALEPTQRFERTKPATGSEGRFSADGSHVLLFGGDDEIQVISLDTDEVLILNTNQGFVGSVSAPIAGSPLLVTGDGSTKFWDLTATGPAELGNLSTSGQIDDVWFSGDASRVLVVEVLPGPVGDRRRISEIDLELDRVARSTSASPASHIVASDDLVVVGSHDDSPGRVESFDGSVTGATLDPCEQPFAIDDAGRWLLVSPSAGSSCELLSGIIDPITGEVLAEMTGRQVESADFGPAGSIAENLLVAEVGIADDLLGIPRAEDIVLGGIEVRRMPGGELLGSIFDTRIGITAEPLEHVRPRFSADGRYLAIGRDRAGGVVVDVQRLLDGERINDAIVLSDDQYPGTTSIVDAGRSWLVGRSGSVLRFLDLASGTVTMTLPLDDGGAFKITPDGGTLYYADSGVVRRFPLDHTELAALARSRVQRELTAAECESYAVGENCATPDVAPS